MPFGATTEYDRSGQPNGHLPLPAHTSGPLRRARLETAGKDLLQSRVTSGPRNAPIRTPGGKPPDASLCATLRSCPTPTPTRCRFHTPARGHPARLLRTLASQLQQRTRRTPNGAPHARASAEALRIRDGRDSPVRRWLHPPPKKAPQPSNPWHRPKPARWDQRNPSLVSTPTSDGASRQWRNDSPPALCEKLARHGRTARYPTTPPMGFGAFRRDQRR
jgi:hypothetical protein